MEDVDHLQEEVNLALSGMRNEYRKAFQLFHEQELSYAEISEALECPLGTVKTWVHRARKEIAAQLCRREVVIDEAAESSSVESQLPGDKRSSSIFGLSMGMS